MNYVAVKKLAQEVGRLQYDVTGKIVSDLAVLLTKEKSNDSLENLKYVSAAYKLDMAVSSIYGVWKICEKHMNNDDECSKHPRIVRGYEIEDVAPKIVHGGDAVSFIECLAEDLFMQAMGDDVLRKRKDTANHLYRASDKLYDALDDLVLM